ncbi:serine/threonine protein kinase [Trichothermofontia sichuanensis B231]|uniref:serine/threonine-protein kinase n=1 Tax=Trichothermofontia sichuanensis TaxID=3045816 RepID=UPI0022471F8C|nr:serine/threonine-protein kinase [Trichothermofontia sichuanensis]UZQ52902.1 serine/threonine protein kinase [Trichothermofontia sichuanensis B231]
MLPPLAAGTTLQNRYRLLGLLGQGGFGRTYLAEDLGRFNERCVLKEYIPIQAGPLALQKSQELFQREAQILYQIQHPQIPQFRATFEHDQRLFLVQDYAAGKTYRTLLNERRHTQPTPPAQGYFTDADIIQLLHDLLPVLSYLHQQGIIHRDISPDNIIQREPDHLPVLIDFGAVKEVATRFQAGAMNTPATTVGKPGYAPSEQMQTGQAYPSSDLYALAVTAIVLMTGREPGELFDAVNLVWHWTQWVPAVHPGLVAILNRMLSQRPGDRYPSAAAVLQDLQTLSPNAPPVPSVPPPPDLSQVKTVAVAYPQGKPVINPATAYGTSPPESSNHASFWDDPWAVGLLGLVLVVLTGIGSWAVVTYVMERQSVSVSPSPTPSPTVSAPPAAPSPSPAPPSPSPQPSEFSERITLKPGEAFSREGQLQAGQTLTLQFSATQGQQLRAILDSEGILMTVLRPDQQPIADRAERVTAWEGELTDTGDYAVQLRPIAGLAKGGYRLELLLTGNSPPEPSPSPSPTPTESPSPEPEPTFNTQVLDIPADVPEVNVSGQTSPQQIKRFIVKVEAGQVLSAVVLSGQAATMDIRYPDGQLVEDATKVLSWQGQVPQTGTYQIDVVAPEPTDFTIAVGVRNPG